MILSIRITLLLVAVSAWCSASGVFGDPMSPNRKIPKPLHVLFSREGGHSEDDNSAAALPDFVEGEEELSDDGDVTSLGKEMIEIIKSPDTAIVNAGNNKVLTLKAGGLSSNLLSSINIPQFISLLASGKLGQPKIILGELQKSEKGRLVVQAVMKKLHYDQQRQRLATCLKIFDTRICNGDATFYVWEQMLARKIMNGEVQM